MKKQKPQIVVLAIIRDGDRFLLTKRSDPNPLIHGRWQLPGGRVEFGEHPEQAVIREIQEELGILVHIQRFIPYIFHKIDKNWHGVFLSYVCIANNKTIVLNEEAHDFKWMSCEEIQKINTLGPVFELLTKI